LIIDLWQP